MIEKFLIGFDGKEMPVVRTDVGKYYFMLPEKKDKNGRKFVEYISREDKAWTFTSRIENDPEYFFRLMLRDDFSIAWENDTSQGVKVSREKFNPNVKSDSKVYGLTKKIYDVAQEIYAHEKLNVPTDKMNQIRELYLRSAIKLLGYQSVDKVKYGTIMCDSMFLLHDIGRMLEKYKNLAQYVHREVSDDGTVVECTSVRDEKTRTKMMSEGEQVAVTLKDATMLLGCRMDALDERRGVNRDYCKNMKRELSDEDYTAYMSVVERTAKLIMGLNYDLLEEVDREGIKDLTGCSELDLEKEISDLIDTSDFNRACYIEDLFVRRECEKLESRIDEEISSSDRVKEALGLELGILKKSVAEEREERDGYIEAYNAQYVRPDVNRNKKAKGLDDTDSEEPVF